MMGGGKIHAKPENKRFRAVIFFSACPVHMEDYDPNEQYNIFSLLDVLHHKARCPETKTMIRMKFEEHLPHYKNKYGRPHLEQALSRLKYELRRAC